MHDTSGQESQPTPSEAMPAPAAWYPSPVSPGYLQYWDGSQWLQMLYPMQRPNAIQPSSEGRPQVHVQVSPPASEVSSLKSSRLQGLAGLEALSGIVWVVIATIQMSLATTSSWLWPLAIAGGWNLVAAVTRFFAAAAIRKGRTDIPERYKRVWPIVLTLLVNLGLGAVFGVLWALFDFFVRSQILSNADLFDPAPSMISPVHKVTT